MEPAWFPVFPLRSVCFPGHRIALRIFEERYLRLLEDAADHPHFVISLISHGSEVGGPATPFRVGTLVRFESIERQGDFQCIKPLGLRRVYLEKLDRARHPYLSAQCDTYGDESADPESAARLPELEARILDMAASTESWVSTRMRELLAGERERLDAVNYSLFLCGCLQLPPIYAQRLLETRSLERRLDDALRLLESGPA